jgi:hypothetical protein
MLSHFRCGGILVVFGQRVARGAIVGYCGNSGRSPVPHLHLNFQSAPDAGAATAPFRLLHYLRIGANRREYIFSGTPAQDERIKAAEFDHNIAAFFENFEDSRWRYKISDGAKTREETIVCTTASNGDYFFQSLTLNASLTARVVDRVFCALDFRGDAHSILFIFGIGLSRVPFTGEQNVTWSDRLALRPLMQPVARALLDLTQPFFPYPLIALTGRIVGAKDFGGNHDTLCIEADIAPNSIRVPVLYCPERVELFLAKQNGIVGAVVKHSTGEIVVERVV